MKEEDMSHYLSLFSSWAEDRGYYVYFEENGDNCICPISKLIEINSSAPLRRQVYCLLHECGHALIIDNGSFWNFEDNKRPELIEMSPHEESSPLSESEKVFTVIEEIEAWERGLKLAQRLKIPICRKEWEVEMADAIKKYIDWAAN